MRLLLSGAVLLVLSLGVPVSGVSIVTGVGPTIPDGLWAPLGWWGSKAIGNAGLTESGFLLSNAQVPPVPSYELALRLIPHKELLFLLESPAPVGKLNVYLDCTLIKVIDVPAGGTWWLLISDLPSSGILRIELGSYCDWLLIRSVNYLAPKCPDCPACWPWFGIGALVGALIVWLILH